VLALLSNWLSGGIGLTRERIPVTRVIAIYIVGAMVGGAVLGSLREHLNRRWLGVLIAGLAAWPVTIGFIAVFRSAQGRRLGAGEWIVSVALSVLIGGTALAHERREASGANSAPPN